MKKPALIIFSTIIVMVAASLVVNSAIENKKSRAQETLENLIQEQEIRQNSAQLKEFVVSVIMSEGIYQKNVSYISHLFSQAGRMDVSILKMTLYDTDLSELVRQAESANEEYLNSQKLFKELYRNKINSHLFPPEFVDNYTTLGNIIEENVSFNENLDLGRFSDYSIKNFLDNAEQYKLISKKLDNYMVKMVE